MLFRSEDDGDWDGAVSGNPFQVSEDAGASSRYPTAAVKTVGASRRVAVVFADARGGDHDAYAAVFDVETLSLLGGNVLLGGSTADDYWPRVAATEAGFVTAWHRTAGDKQVMTRLLGDDGALAGDPIAVSKPEAARLPIAVGSDGAARVAIAFRGVVEDALSTVYVRALSSAGEPLGDLDDGVVVGDSLDDSSVSWTYKSRYAIAWDAAAAAWLVAFDSEPGVPFGDPAAAEVLVGHVAEDASAFDAPFALSDDANRSVQPTLAVGARALVLWHDNRDEIATDASYAEIYAATLECP